MLLVSLRALTAVLKKLHGRSVQERLLNSVPTKLVKGFGEDLSSRRPFELTIAVGAWRPDSSALVRSGSSRTALAGNPDKVKTGFGEAVGVRG